MIEKAPKGKQMQMQAGCALEYIPLQALRRARAK